MHGTFSGKNPESRPEGVLSRRNFLRSAGRAGVSALAVAGTGLRWSRSAPEVSRIDVDLGTRVGRISPNIYGHLAEHIGRLIYDGLWVGVDSPIRNQRGIRWDAVEALRRLGAPVIRWPGGCFADSYHWRDGIGPPEKRPLRRNLWWNQPESNAFGTHEFLDLCELVGSQAYISINVGSGSVQEALEWLEYCNSEDDTALTRLRAQNGHPRPYGVRYWGVGNENWGCGGVFSPRDYAREYLRYALYLKRGVLSSLGISAVPPQLVAVGHTEGDWNREFLEEVRRYPPLIDHLSIHHYFRKRGMPLNTPPGGIPEKGDVLFGESEYYELIGSLGDLESQVRDTVHLLDDHFKEKKIGLAVDEWGTWYPQAVIENGFFQQNTVRDAVVAGSVLNFFNTQCRHVTMSNIAQSFNVMQAIGLTRGSMMVLTPTFYAIEMYRQHQGAELIPARIEAPSLALGSKNGGIPRKALNASASLKSGRLFLTVVNEHLTRDLECRMELREGRARAVTGHSLTAPEVNSHNSFDDPNRVRPEAAAAALDDGRIRLRLPAHSVNAFDIELG